MQMIKFEHKLRFRTGLTVKWINGVFWVDFMIDYMLFNTIFNIILNSCIVTVSAPIYSFLELFLQVHILCTSHWLLSNITSIKTMDCSEAGMNPV